jgi:hypothetical protein
MSERAILSTITATREEEVLASAVGGVCARHKADVSKSLSLLRIKGHP